MSAIQASTTTPPTPDWGGEGLPLLSLEKIMSYLRPKDIQSVAAVNRRWKDTAVDFTRSRENSKVIRLAQFLVSKLDKTTYAEQIKALELLTVDTSIIGSTSLITIKELSARFWRRIFGILKELPMEELDRLAKEAIVDFEQKLTSLTQAISAIATETNNKLDEVKRSDKDQTTQLRESMAIMRQALEGMTPSVAEGDCSMNGLWAKWKDLLEKEQKFGNNQIFYKGMGPLFRDHFKPLFEAVLSPFTHVSNFWGDPNLDISGLDKEEAVRLNGYKLHFGIASNRINRFLTKKDQEISPNLASSLVTDFRFLMIL